MKKLNLLIIGDDVNTLECIKIGKEYGHEISGCITNSPTIYQYCQSEEIAYFGINDSITLSEDQIDYCLEINNISYQQGFLKTFPRSKWIKLLGQTAITQLAWYAYNQDNNKLIKIKNYSQDALESFHNLLIDLSRETLQLDHNSIYPNVAKLFEQKVNSNPNGTAIIFEDKQYTYQQLEDASNAIANHLSEKNIKNNPFVVLKAERSFELIAGILGIFKAGACYVPVNPKLPAQRINYIIELTKTQTVLDESSISMIINSTDSIDFTPVDEHDLAYLLFTSGTTGLPKGVAITQESLFDRLTWLKNKLNINCDDSVLHHTNIGFDVSIEEIFLPLISSGKLVLAPLNVHENMEKLAILINKHKITFIEFVPSLLNMFLDSNDLKKCVSLRYIISGGEPLHHELLDKFYENSQATLINFYGPTETTINASYHICQRDEIKKSQYVPIGLPVGNVEFYVLNQAQQPVTNAEVGELYIGGNGIAKGYLKDNLFIENCCTFLPNGTKLYKTGDLVRYCDANTLEFIGRVDRQIKLRGFRIELEEVECALTSYPDTKQVAVFTSGDEDYKKQLIVFMAFPIHHEIFSDNNYQEKLKDFCKASLPNYMIPHVFCLVDRIPLTLNDKIDYQALLTIFQNKSDKKTRVSLNTNHPLEKLVQEVWSQILEEDVDVQDNFFDLGGNSLSAVQVVAALNKKNLPVSVADIFQYPTVYDLVHLSNKINTETVSLNSIPTISRNQKIPLSYAQQRLWYLYQLEETPNSSYNIAMAFKLKGQLQVKNLEYAINLLIQRHEILRTIFKSQNGKPWQEILPYFPIYLDKVNISEDELENELIEETHIPFNIEQGPLSRFKLYQITPEFHVLSISMHNIITDGWSESIIITEINNIYNALENQSQISLSNLTIQYGDYSHWQRQSKNQDKQKENLPYWVKKLTGYTELKLASECENVAENETMGKDIKFCFDNHDLIKKLHLLAQRAHTTPYVILVTAFNLLLAFRSNQYDIVIGSGMAGRNDSELEKLIGFFVNTVVLRNDLNGNPTFIELIERVRGACVEAHQYQDVPFEMIVDALMLEREENKNPIFQVLFILQKAGDDVNLNLNHLECENILIGRKTATFDITFNAALTGNRLFGDIQYNSKLFTKKYIENFLIDFKAILEYMICEPDTHIQSAYTVITDDSNAVQKQSNNTELSYPDYQLHELFELNAQRNPESVAISYKNETITYRVLNEKSTKLAMYLSQFPHKIVGISLERSIDYVIAVLATLKIGGIFLPLDPEYPIDRLSYYINHSGLDIVLCNSTNSHVSAFTKLAKVIILDDAGAPNITSQNTTVHKNDCCYILYTSGSTGNPKGIVASHASVMNLLSSIQTSLSFTANDKLLSVTSINFDISYLEIFLPLISGGTCILADQHAVKDSKMLIDLITKTRPSLIQATPSFWSMLMEHPTEVFRDVKILVGGEPLTTSLAKKLIANFKEVWNVYGPTETTIWSTIKKIIDPENITIGKPLSNTKCYVLNDYLNPVPLNVIGELYIAGLGLSKGYINDPEQTKSNFIDNPYATSTSPTLYKTGDFVRYLSNGEIQYIGRKDQQVKMRGHRIELTEIESCILKYDGILEVAVTFNDLLSAFYVVSNNKLNANIQNIQKHLLMYLPAYFMPNKWIQLNELPKTLNGKIDRKKLCQSSINELKVPVLETNVSYSEIDYKIIAIWSNVLKIDANLIGLNDSFFMVGGHSLLIPQVIFLINRDLSSRITIRDFIQNPTIQQLSLLVETYGKNLKVAV